MYDLNEPTSLQKVTPFYREGTCSSEVEALDPKVSHLGGGRAGVEGQRCAQVRGRAGDPEVEQGSRRTGGALVQAQGPAVFSATCRGLRESEAAPGARNRVGTPTLTCLLPLLDTVPVVGDALGPVTR